MKFATKFIILVILFAITFVFLFDHWCRLRKIQDICEEIKEKL